MAVTLMFGTVWLIGCGGRSQEVVDAGPPRVDAGVVVFARTVPTALARFENQTDAVAIVTFSDSSGHSTEARVPPRGRTQGLVVAGTAHLKAVAADDDQILVDQDFTAAVGEELRPIIALRAPLIAPTNLGNLDPTKPSFTCTGKDQAAVVVEERSGTTFIRFDCLDPSQVTAPTLQSLTFNYPTSVIGAGGKLPEPMFSCVKTFQLYQTSPTATFFELYHSPFGITCHVEETPPPLALVPGFIPGYTATYENIPWTFDSTPTALDQVRLSILHTEFPADAVHNPYTFEDRDLFPYLRDVTHTGFDNELSVGIQADEIHDVVGVGIQIAAPGQVPTTGRPPSCANVSEGGFYTLPGIFPATFKPVAGSEWRARLQVPPLPGFNDGQIFLLRVVPVAADGACRVLPSNWITVTFLGVDPTSGPPIVFPPPPPVPPSAYQYDIVGYTAPRWTPRTPDAFRHILITRANPKALGPYGCAYLAQWPPPPADSPPWYAVIFNAISSAVDAVGHIYDQLKNAVVNVASIACGGGQACKALMTSALDVGLASLGLPPNLPNLDQLLKNGGSYLSGYVADSTGVPADVAQVLVDSLVDKTRDALAGTYNAKDAFSWGIPDPYYSASPSSIIWVRVTRDADPSKTAGSVFEVGDYVSGQPRIWKPTFLRTPSSLKPGTSTVIPVVLQPDLKGLTPANSSQLVSYNNIAKFSNWLANDYKDGLANTVLFASGASLAIQSGVSVGNYEVAPPATPCH